jgi:uncharacterized protein YceK
MTKKWMAFAISLFFLLLSGCGTINTLAPVDNHVKISHGGKKSYCKSIPRVYSGTCYELCKFYGEPSEDLNLGSTFNGIPFFIIDIPLSFVSDTILLPYTGIKQYSEGSISVN